MAALRGKPAYGSAVEVDARGGGASTSGSGGNGPLGTSRNRTDLFLKYRRQARGGSRPLAAPGTTNGERCACQAALGLPACLGRNELLQGSCSLQAPSACSLETARLMASALGGIDSAEAGLGGVAAALPPQYVEFKEQIRL